MSKEPQNKTIVCPMITPFDQNYKIDYSKIPVLLDHLYAGGIRSLLVAGTTGEGMLMSVDERKKLLEAVIENGNDRFEIIAHTGSTSTLDTIELTEHGKSIGADAASVITPYFFKYSQDELYDHYAQIAKAAEGFPILMYSFPGNAGNFISTDLYKKLIEHFPNYAGIKLSDVNLIQFQEYVANAPETDFRVLCGVDALMLPALSVGSDGQVSGNSNVFPEVFCGVLNAFESNDLTKAAYYQGRIAQIRGMFLDNIAYFKAALKILGLDMGPTRSPIHWHDDSELQQLKKKIEWFTDNP
jgi:4-hydroxy-tetrahydrodipicolinate synthase